MGKFGTLFFKEFGSAKHILLQNTPLLNEEFYGLGWVFQQKEPKIPGTHKIGAAISGPRIAGETFYRHEVFSDSM